MARAEGPRRREGHRATPPPPGGQAPSPAGETGSPASWPSGPPRSSALLENQREVNRVVLVVEAQRVHADVDACPDGQLALRLTPRNHFEGIVAALVPGPGSRQVILRVEHRGAATDEGSVKLRVGKEAAGSRVEQVETLEHDMRRRQRLQRG